MTQLKTPEVLVSGTESFMMYTAVTKANPLMSEVIGFNYYGDKYFHLFAELRLVQGNHMSTYSKPQSLNELRFSFGLGFNLN